MANLERHTQVSPYHYCMKCWRRISLDELRWQQGYLVCNWDYDSMVLGEREMMIARVLNANPQLEMEPDKKLQFPSAGGLVEEIIL